VRRATISHATRFTTLIARSSCHQTTMPVRLDVARDARIDLAQPLRLAERDGEEDLLERLAVERLHQGERLVEHDAERVDVGAVVDGDPLGERLLGAQVVRRAGDVAGAREAARLLVLREAEVGEVRGALLVEEDVLRLDVAVDHAVLVDVRQRLGDLERRPERLLDRAAQRGRVGAPHRLRALAAARLDPLVEVAARHPLHGEEAHPAVGARFEELHDVGVAQAARRGRLVLEAVDAARRRRDRGVQDLPAISGMRRRP
jgi:hypothetical protein